ncbi:MAG TPA: DUF2520 domain-containing protein [Bacteroidia bacterium]|nr:DUF2520 domain-containing protein [Bacteroidia bacterium]
MTKSLNIVVIGVGNVACHIANSFSNKKSINIVQVFNHRKSNEAKKISKDFNCHLVTDYSEIILNADVYIIAVKDDAIAEVAKKLAPLNLKGIVVHTSGSVDMSVLKRASQKIGVYYPLQTFYKGAYIDWNATPLLIEGNSKGVEANLKYLASLVSEKVKIVDSKKRLQIHLAAVFACNFTNAMYVSAYQIIENNLSKKDTDLLLPIMKHSFQKLEKIHPIKAQTGPAMRNDQLAIKKHLNLIKQNKQLTAVYKLLSDLIVAQQNSK